MSFLTAFRACSSVVVAMWIASIAAETTHGQLLAKQSLLDRETFWDNRDWDWYKEGAGLKAGGQVVVSGRVDNDFVAKKRIEASSVYVRNLGTYFYANAADEETVPLPTLGMASAPGQVDATGTVRAIEGREFTIGSGSGPLRVDTSAMAENPLDNDGFLQVKAGDRVYVWGSWDAEMSENPELKAKGVIRFARDGTKAGSA